MTTTSDAPIARATVGLKRLESIKASHHDLDRFGEHSGACRECEYLWPCDSARLIAALEKAIPMIDSLSDQCEVYATVEEAAR